MRRLLSGSAAIAAAAAIGGFMTPVSAQESADAKFLMDAIRGNMAEVKIGQLAESHANSDAARDLGKMLATDHSKGLQKTTSLARSKDITVPTDVTAEQKQTYDKLAKLSGSAFDRELAQTMVADHKKDIAAYQKEAMTGKDSEIMDLAKDTLPTLEEHLEHAQKLAGGSEVRTSQRPDTSGAPHRAE
jgi:putative membrane protein